MSKQTQGSLALVGTIAGGIFLVAFVVLLVIGQQDFNTALFLALAVALAAAIFMFIAFHKKPATPEHPSASKPVTSTPSHREPAPSPAEPAPAPAAAPVTAAPASPEPVAEPPAPEPVAEAPAPSPEPSPAPSPQVDYDGDGVVEGRSEGSRPSALDGPRGGQADNLKEIKGVGPKLEKLLNSLGFYHFDQVANWTADEVAWVDANLEGFSGRVSRDQWVEQARILAAGGETEFSKRVDEGDVY